MPAVSLAIPLSCCKTEPDPQPKRNEDKVMPAKASALDDLAAAEPSPQVVTDYDGAEAEDTGFDGINRLFDPTRIRIRILNPSISLLLTRIRENEIDLQPDFQRTSLWTDRQQSQLIESILIRIPLPAFYFDATDEDRWLVVDGQQRLWALNRFAIVQDLKLTGLEFLYHLNGKGFADLPRKYQRRIEESPITAYLIEPGTPEALKFVIFRRLNTTSLPLSSQEIRHALYQGKAQDFLRRLAESEEFLRATAHSVSGKRMADRECALRFLAFVTTAYSEYRKVGITAYLNEKMIELNGFSDELLAELEHRFLRAMRAAEGIFDDDAFRKRYDPDAPRSPINKALFEAWSVSLDACSDEDIERLVERRDQVRSSFRHLLADDRGFETAISFDTGNPAKVRKRFTAIEELMRKVLG